MTKAKKNNKLNNVTQIAEDQKVYIVPNQGDIDQVKSTIDQINNILLVRGRIRTDYLREDRRLEQQLEASINSQEMIVNMLRQKVGAPQEYVLNLSTFEFIPPPNFKKE